MLLGQNQVVNWVRSTPTSLATMRYPGEFKLPGGNVDPTDGSTLAAARRELHEELLKPAGLEVPADAILRPFAVRQTKASNHAPRARRAQPARERLWGAALHAAHTGVRWR